ncbi:hypothetical protein, partial [Bordetella pertussis]
VGDFQFLKSGSDEPCIQPIESSQLGGNMEYVAVFSSLAILSILALLAKTIQSAGSETLVKISATVISSTFAFLLIIPIAFAMFMSLE